MEDKTADLARAIGVDYLQGWGIEKPKPLDTLIPGIGAGTSASA